MKLRTLEREQLVHAPLDEVFRFFSEPRNLGALTPDWLGFSMSTPESVPMRRGTLLDYTIRLHRIPIRWRTLIEIWEPGVRFVDLQLRGPYKLWSHLHEFESRPEGTLVRDEILYALPAYPLGEVGHALLVKRDLQRIFDYRRLAVSRLLEAAPPRGSAATA